MSDKASNIREHLSIFWEIRNEVFYGHMEKLPELCQELEGLPRPTGDGLLAREREAVLGRARELLSLGKNDEIKALEVVPKPEFGAKIAKHRLEK